MTDNVTRALLRPLMLYAACGLVLSLAAHLSALVGQPLGGNRLFLALHVGIFPLWIPVVLISMKITRGMRLEGRVFSTRKEYREALLSGCPPWMKYMVYGFFIYAIVNFTIFVVMAPTVKPLPTGETPIAVWRGFSGHWMVFYGAGLAILTTAYRRGLSNLQPRCPNGHGVGFGDKYCPTCGLAIKEHGNSRVAAMPQ
jgi:hypothetical protein